MQNQNPLITVITVTYNAAPVIRDTLKSLEEQTFREFEHLVIDGASKDNTLNLIKDFSLNRSRIISEKDKGLYDAMNKGLKEAKGKYVIFINAGDRFHDPESLHYYALAASNDPDIIYGDTVIVNQKGDVIAPRHLSAPRVLTKDSFANGMLICHQAFMVKKDLAPLYDLKYRFSADYDWCVKCISNSERDKCINLNKITIDYLNDGLTDHNKFPSLKERFNIMTHHYGFLKTTLKHLGFIFRAAKRGKI